MEQKKFKKIYVLPIALIILFSSILIFGDINLGTGEVFIFNKTIDLFPLNAVSYEDYKFETDSGYINVTVKNNYIKSYQTVLVGVYDINTKKMITYDSTYILSPGESKKMTFKLTPGEYIVKQTSMTYSKGEVLTGLSTNGLMTYSGLICITDSEGIKAYEKAKSFSLFRMDTTEKIPSVVQTYLDKYNSRTGASVTSASDLYKLDTNCEEAKIIKMYYVMNSSYSKEKLTSYGVDITSKNYEDYDSLYNTYAIAKQKELESIYGENASFTFNVRAGINNSGQQITLSRTDSSGNTVTTVYDNNFIQNYATQSTAAKEQFTKDIYLNGSAQYIISNIYALQSANAGKELYYWEPPADFNASGFDTFKEAISGVTLTKKSAGLGAVEPLISALVNSNLTPNTPLSTTTKTTEKTELGNWYECRTTAEKPIADADIPNNTSTQELKNLNSLKGKDLETITKKMFDEINTHRKDMVKVGVLEYSKTMSLNAQSWAIFCHDYNLYDHEYNGKESITYTAKFKQWGYTSGTSEIMYYGSEYPMSSDDVKKIIDAWVKSSSHKEALENKDMKYVGIGVYPITGDYDKDGKYVNSVTIKNKSGEIQDEVKDGKVKYVWVVHLSKEEPKGSPNDETKTGSDGDKDDDDDGDKPDLSGNLIWFLVLGIFVVVIFVVIFMIRR